jgi:two-component system CheB/CheR fusion protein
MSEERSKEERLAAIEAELRDANRRKDEFLAALSHELRNPLTPVRNCLYVLSEKGAKSEQGRRAMETIDRQITQLARLVDDLLDVTRIVTGKIQLRLEHAEVADLVRRTLQDHRTSLERRGIRLMSRLEPGPFWVKADPVRLTQALSNLLGNAEKFTPRGGGVEVVLRRNDRRLNLTVRDSGVGIAPDMIAHVFEPFTQAPQTLDRARGGLGLGLALVKEIVELLGGTVSVRSGGVGQGTEFVVSLPLSPPPSERATVAHEVEAPRRRVLVIDDNADVADTIMEALSCRGHDVRKAYDAEAGLEQARRFHPEVVFCDIGLPDMDGYALAKAVREEEALRWVYLVALSGYAQPADVQRAMDAGFNRHVAKPPSLEQLDRVLADAPHLHQG